MLTDKVNKYLMICCYASTSIERYTSKLSSPLCKNVLAYITAGFIVELFDCIMMDITSGAT